METFEPGDPICHKKEAGFYQGGAPIENSKAMASVEIGDELRIVPKDELSHRQPGYEHHGYWIQPRERRISDREPRTEWRLQSREGGQILARFQSEEKAKAEAEKREAEDLLR